MVFTTLFKVYMHQIHLVVVARFRSNLRPIHRIKHVTDSQFATAAGTPKDIVLALSVDAPTLAGTAQVETGSTINAIFLSVEVVNTGVTGVLANCYFYIMKNPGGNLTLPAANAVGADDNKRYVFHQEMIMLQMIDNSNPRTLFKGVLKLPRGYRRMAINDELTIRIFSPGIEITGCVQCHYKELR